MRSPDFENLNSVKPDLSLIRELKDKAFIKTGSPLWWSTDYAPDPRVYLTFDEFTKRLVHLGEMETIKVSRFYDTDLKWRDIYLYPEPQVPMSVLELDVDVVQAERASGVWPGYSLLQEGSYSWQSKKLPFLITARPCHPKEKLEHPLSLFLLKNSFEKLEDLIKNGEPLGLHDHFYPHIRGLFAGRRGNHVFWYPLRVSTWWYEFGEKIDQALKSAGLPFIGFYEPWLSEDRRNTELWNELLGMKGLVDPKNFTWVDFPWEEVSANEFIESWQDRNEKELLVVYPQRVPGVEHTAPLVITAMTHKWSKIRKPVILGIYADNGASGRCRHEGICRIKDRLMAAFLSEAISEDFGITVDALLYTPQPGRPKYERV